MPLRDPALNAEQWQQLDCDDIHRNVMRRKRMFGWWYICIGLAFVALALRTFMAGAPGGWLRLVVAAGFELSWHS